MIRTITIVPVLNGFILTVGCQQVVFESVDKLVDNVRDYLREPEKTEKSFVAGAIKPEAYDGGMAAGADAHGCRLRHRSPGDAPHWDQPARADCWRLSGE